MFDHGAPFFTASNPQVLSLVQEWETRGLVAEWKENFGSFDSSSSKFIDIEQVYMYCFLYFMRVKSQAAYYHFLIDVFYRKLRYVSKLPNLHFGLNSGNM